MIQFTAHTAETAPAASRPFLQGIGRTFGYVPNLFGVFAESPATLRGALAIYEAFSTSSLAAVEQQIVMIAVSEANACEYCVAAHSTLARQTAKVDRAVIDAVRNRAPLADARLDALATFTRKVVDQRGRLDDAEVAAFIDAGYTRAQLIEVLLGVGMKTFNNYVAHIAHTPLNEEFLAEAWEPRRWVA
jgi:uncharacterized peroxidase-related enzyme